MHFVPDFLAGRGSTLGHRNPAMNTFRPGLAFFILFIGGIAAQPARSAEPPALRVRPQTIDAAIQIGYGLAVADVDGDGKDDVLLADAKQIVWYRNPTWQKFVMVEQLTARDNVCIAARDLDGDGKAEVAVGAQWNPGDTTNSGAVFLLEPAADRTHRWRARKLPHEPTTHRMAWVEVRRGQYSLAVLPLHGRGNKTSGEGAGVNFLGYSWPWPENGGTEAFFGQEAGLHQTHNLDVIWTPGTDEPLLAVAAKEGVRFLERRRGDWRLQAVSTRPAGEVRVGYAGPMFVTTIEPMHGNQVVVYPAPAAGEGDWNAQRIVVDDTLVQGHALATGDLLGIGADQIVAGWRGGGGSRAKVGIKLFVATDTRAQQWKMHALIDDDQMACEDLRLADLNGDGRIDVVAAGRATKNVVIYWNETAR